MKRFFGVALWASAIVLLTGIFSVHSEPLKVENGRNVTFDYALTVDGKVIDSSQKGGPITYAQGSGQIIPGLEKELMGLKAGDEKNIVLSAENGYGPVNPNAFREVPKSDLPKDLKPEVGRLIAVHGQDGRAFPALVTEIKKDTIVLNFNHPLAGKELHFQVKILSVN